MSPIAEFRLRSPDMALASTLSDAPDVRLEVVSGVATDPGRPALFFWARGGNLEDFEAAMRADETVAAVDRLNAADGQVLFRVQVSDAPRVVFYTAWNEFGLQPFESSWADGWWQFRMQFPDRETLSAVREWCSERDVDFRLDRVYTDEAVAETDTVLTEEQRQVLQTAYELGYFEIPRDASMADVAAALDLSSQAVSERLRRGYRQLVADAVL